MPRSPIIVAVAQPPQLPEPTAAQRCAGPKGEGGLDDATGASGAAGGASYKQTSNVIDLSESLAPARLELAPPATLSSASAAHGRNTQCSHPNQVATQVDPGRDPSTSRPAAKVDEHAEALRERHVLEAMRGEALTREGAGVGQEAAGGGAAGASEEPRGRWALPASLSQLGAMAAGVKDAVVSAACRLLRH
jgi:hypothetical protein